MPGILPMKVIKIGSTAQARIAQACDRCRSKKIRCDGIRPCCTQCASVGFECKTSDKLSRRAFPRGYTESLEERVRTLETEVRELKELLDEKDEKIDMLSRIHSNSPQSILHTSPRRQSDSSTEAHAREQAFVDESGESFHVRQSPTLLGDGSDSYFAGTSSASNFVASFAQQAAASGYTVDETDSTQLLSQNLGRRTSETPSIQSASAVIWCAPPRLLSDQLINIFFQEWAPLFPVLHRPSFLATYEKYVANADAITDNAQLAHLNLVFAIAAASSGTGADELNSFETQWKAAVDAIINDTTIETLQALALAQIQCLQRNDFTRLLSYKGVSTSLSTRLGLHQVQNAFALNTLSSETRKKLFWTLYTVDCFSSVILGLPKHIKDTDVFCEYPVDADDEYLSENGFQPSLPGESTKLSSALALFRATRILSRILDQVFPAKVSFDLSLKNLSDFSDELELWESSLPAHLRLHFAQDKPSTGTITSRSPILSLVYHYIRALIQRPAIAAASLGNKASSALLTHASSCKSIVQIVQLLEERGLSFSMCLNKHELLVLCGIGTLFQRLKLNPASKILKDNKNVLTTIYQHLHKSGYAGVNAYCNIVKSIVADFDPTAASAATKTSEVKSKPNVSRSNSDHNTTSGQSTGSQSSTRRHLKAIASRFSAASNSKVPTLATQPSGHISMDSLSLHPQSTRSREQPSLSPPARVSPSLAASTSDTSLSPTFTHSRPLSVGTTDSSTSPLPTCKPSKIAKRRTMPALTNLDYLSFGLEPEQEDHGISCAGVNPVKTEPQPTDWERLLCDLDNGPINLFDAPYNGVPFDDFCSPIQVRQQHSRSAISDAALAWNAGLLSLQEMSKRAPKASVPNGSTRTSNSHWSALSDESLGSSDGLSVPDWTSTSSNHDVPDTFTSLDLVDIGVDFNFGTELEPNWQENLVNGSA